jgi:protein-S-isoprenylcysteine O-methyltransferase Ste14
MGASWRIGVDTQPGVVLMVPNWLSLLALVMLGVAVQIQVRTVEEPYLTAVHGQTCRDAGLTTGPRAPQGR